MKAKIMISLIPLLLCSCSDNSALTSGSDSTTEIKEKIDFTPQVGEVREWFSHGEIGEDRFYNYCPSTLVENNTKHVFYCSNKMFGNITDYVAYRKMEYVDGNFNVTSTEDMKFLLSPTKETWDSRHVCDPSVIKGEFSYDNVQYQYLMAYLGCVTSDCTRNETGLAVSNSLEGPWIKCDKINPIVPVEDDSNKWGNGQPELISVDHKGRVILCVSHTNNTISGEQAFEYDFSNLNEPKLIRSKEIMNTNGIYNVPHKDGETVSNYICNIGLAYDSVNKKIIMAKGRNPFGKDGLYPNFIADTIDVYYLDDSGNASPFDELFKSSNEARNWVHMGTINEELTGFKRNHNTGIVTNPYGEVVEADRIEVAFTRSDLSDADWGYLSTYRIYSTSFKLAYLD